jgi:hypothetical protein
LQKPLAQSESSEQEAHAPRLPVVPPVVPVVAAVVAPPPAVVVAAVVAAAVVPEELELSPGQLQEPEATSQV